jgi:hypothetical protein
MTSEASRNIGEVDKASARALIGASHSVYLSHYLTEESRRAKSKRQRRMHRIGDDYQAIDPLRP